MLRDLTPGLNKTQRLDLESVDPSAVGSVEVGKVISGGTISTLGRAPHGTLVTLRFPVGTLVKSNSTIGLVADYFQVATSNTLTLRSTGFAWVEVARATTNLVDSIGAIEVVNDAAEKTVYSVSVPGNFLGPSGIFEGTIHADYLNNTGVSQTYTIRIKFGGTTIFQDTTGSIVANASRRPWRLDVTLVNRGVTNSQFGGALRFLGSAGGSTIGAGDYGTAGIIGSITQGIDPAIDTTVDQVFAVTFQHTNASANLSWRKLASASESPGHGPPPPPEA